MQKITNLLSGLLPSNDDEDESNLSKTSFPVINKSVHAFKNWITNTKNSKDPPTINEKFFLIHFPSLYALYLKSSTKLTQIPNIYANNHASLMWINENKKQYAAVNYPFSIEFDFPIKKDIIERSLQLEENAGILDCGAHIGDLSIPLDLTSLYMLLIRQKTNVIL